MLKFIDSYSHLDGTTVVLLPLNLKIKKFQICKLNRLYYPYKQNKPFHLYSKTFQALFIQTNISLINVMYD